MRNLGLIDDTDKQRITVRDTIAEELDSSWKIIDTSPPKTIRQAIHWIHDNDISVLLLDEKLSTTKPVDYDGHALASAIRSQNKEFPVYIVTAFGESDELTEVRGDVEEIFQRKTLIKDIAIYAKRFMRAGSHYVKNHEADLATLTRISARAARGVATATETRKLEALQASLQLRLNEAFDTKATAPVEALEAALEEAEAAQKELEKYLAADSKRAPKRKAKQGKSRRNGRA